MVGLLFYPLSTPGSQLKEAIERTPTEQLLQEKRMEVAKDPRSRHATVTVVDAGRAERIRVASEKAGASVWEVRALDDQRTSLRAAYLHKRETIEAISTALDKAHRSEDVVVDEGLGGRAPRINAVSRVERERQPPSREQGISM